MSEPQAIFTAHGMMDSFPKEDFQYFLACARKQQSFSFYLGYKSFINIMNFAGKFIPGGQEATPPAVYAQAKQEVQQIQQWPVQQWATPQIPSFPTLPQQPAMGLPNGAVVPQGPMLAPPLQAPTLPPGAVIPEGASPYQYAPIATPQYQPFAQSPPPQRYSSVPAFPSSPMNPGQGEISAMSSDQQPVLPMGRPDAPAIDSNTELLLEMAINLGTEGSVSAHGLFGSFPLMQTQGDFWQMLIISLFKLFLQLVLNN